MLGCEKALADAIKKKKYHHVRYRIVAVKKHTGGKRPKADIEKSLKAIVANVNQVHRASIDYFGKEALKIYGFPPDYKQAPINLDLIARHGTHSRFSDISSL